MGFWDPGGQRGGFLLNQNRQGFPQGREHATRRALGWCLNLCDVSYVFLADGPRA